MSKFSHQFYSSTSTLVYAPTGDFLILDDLVPENALFPGLYCVIIPNHATPKTIGSRIRVWFWQVGRPNGRGRDGWRAAGFNPEEGTPNACLAYMTWFQVFQCWGQAVGQDLKVTLRRDTKEKFLGPQTEGVVT